MGKIRMKRYIISLLISADLVLTFSLACPAWAGLLSFQGWAIEQDQTDDIGYT
jgi:hypothetical protein